MKIFSILKSKHFSPPCQALDKRFLKKSRNLESKKKFFKALDNLFG